jgi:tetratricopeptide (TPR) repeat protein
MATSDETSGRQPLSPAVRRRLQMCFEHGSKSAAKSDFNYATDMFYQCVLADLGNTLYVKQFLSNLCKKYNDNKKGAGFTSAPKATALKGSIKKAHYSKDWPTLTKSGLEMLKLNPWDISTLSAMADVCNTLGHDESQLAFLKQALDVNVKDVEVNRTCGRALARLGQFDQAIACWQRVLQGKADDEEAMRAVGDLAVEKTISHGGYEDAESSNDVKSTRGGKVDALAELNANLTPQQLLEKAIAKKPDDLGKYLELADLHTRDEKHKEAEAVLAKALEVSGGDVAIRERLEDSQLRRHRHQLTIAEKQAAQKKTPESLELLKRIKAELNSAEMDVYRNRAERYPANFGLKYELGVRMKRAGMYQEAIQCFQKATGDGKRKAVLCMELGECFQHIKQYKLAMDNYEAALEALTGREADQRKLGLYRAGKLAFGLAEKFMTAEPAQAKDNLERAEKYLSELAGLEFGYKDTPLLLDKIAKMRHKD